MKLKKTCIIQNSIKTVLIFRIHYIKKLLKENHEISVIAPNDCEKSKKILQELGVTVHSIPSLSGIRNIIFSFAKMNSLILYYRFRGYNFICHFIVTILITYLTLVPFNKNLILSIEGMGSIFTDNALPQKILKLLLQSTRATNVFMNSSDLKLMNLKNSVIINGIGVDLDVFNTEEKKVNDSQQFNLLYVGRLINDKGVNDAIEVLKQLLIQGVNVKLRLIGDVYENNPSSLTKENIKYVSEKYKDHIEFLGFRSDVDSWYKISDVLILPSKREGFPVCIMEATASGIPSICYDVPGCSDAIRDGINGFLIEYRNINQMVDTTKNILNFDTLNFFKSSCFKYACEHFNIKNQTDKLINILLDPASQLSDSTNTLLQERYIKPLKYQDNRSGGASKPWKMRAE